MNRPHLYYFKPHEFRRGEAEWFCMMSPRLLVLLDLLRFRWGRPIHLSAAAGAIGRHAGPEHDSQHNVDLWHEVRALDVIPEGLTERDHLNRFYRLAAECGFTGIGFYPQWHQPGFHLDAREDRLPGYPATWGALDGAGGNVYVSFTDALDVFA